MTQNNGLVHGLRQYIRRQASSLPRYCWESLVMGCFGWVPSIVGIALRALFYRLILRMQGVAAIESRVRLRFADRIRLGRNVYLDEGVYIHACPNGVEIGENTFVMHHAELHVYNFRDIPHAGIRIGMDSLIGEFNVLRGQGGITIGNRVYFAPLVQVLAVNHVFDDPTRPFVDQGITAQGIVIEDDVWVGAGAIILDGVHIGHGAVVGAGAVVAEDVPAQTLVAGVPARPVRKIDGTWSAVPPGVQVFPSIQGGARGRS
jgi:acetyltransferase-like isoleucine patch superfamily enzyme